MKLKGLKNQAWVTSAVTDEEARKSIVLASSLKRVLSNRSVVILASTKVTPALRERLHYEFDNVFILEDDRNNVNLKPEDFAKLSALTLKSFEKCVFVSPGMMFLKNGDMLFDAFENSSFVCLDNDTALPIFLFKPSMDSYHGLMKALSTRNGTPVGAYIEKWFCNNQPGNHQREGQFHLEPKYCRKISLKHNGNLETPPLSSDSVIVNFLGDPTVYKECENTEMSLIDHHAIKTWIELYYNDSVKRPSSIPQNNFEVSNLSNVAHDEYQKEPIAIVGMSCRYPGSNNLEEFWNLLFSGEDGTGNPPPFRWLREQSSRNRPDCRATNAGFLKVPVDDFDARFFGISPKEMLFLDPQNRLLHELVWESLEDAAIDPLKLRGSNGGVFMGSWTNDFKDILIQAGVSEFYRTYMGNSIGAAAARISFLLGLTGPSVATESGCSSAMVAVQLACRSLQLGETNLALACGVNLLLHPFDKDEMPMVISPEGRSKTFDSRADGFARGEGCGVLVLKRLSDAIRDGDNIWAMIRGCGVSQEGTSRSMGTPTIHCESLAMQMALNDAQVKPHEVSYVEAHGTGTVVGDPMEIAAISKAYHSNLREDPLIIGSVKTNVGHTESCSGITGIMKVVLAMHHEVIPPHRNFETLNPNINLESVPAIIPLKSVEWKKHNNGRRRLAGVSSFGITGTDAHAIIEEPPQIPSTKCVSSLERPQHILKVSAKTEEALDILLERYTEKIQNSSSDLKDIAYTANIGRANFPWRAALIGKTTEDIVKNITENSVMKQEIPSEEHGKICFLFTGQGSQYPGMAKQLYGTCPIFRIHFDYCDNILKNMYKISIRDVLWGKMESEVSRTIYSQTSIFCVEYALLKMWESWGIHPDFAVGHSLGEFCAAVCAGLLMVEDAIKLVAERSRLIDALPHGKMLVIKADKNVVNSTMKSFSGGDPLKLLDYAAINSNQQTVVAGDSKVVLEFARYCAEKRQLKSIVLEATHAFHSKHMDPMLDEYRDIAKTLARNLEQKCLYISGMRGELVEPDSVDAEYWVQHTRQPVNFLDASKIAADLGCQIFIEIGPQPVLSALMMMNTDGVANLHCLPSLKKKEDEWTTVLQSLAKLYLQGVTIDWEGFDELYSRKKVRLPQYPFIGKKFWPDLMATTGHTIHPLLGSIIPNASSTKLFQNGLNLRSLEYVKDHAIGQNVIFPGAGYLEMCLAAGHATVECASDSLTRPSRPIMVENLSISAPLALDESKTCQVQVVVEFNTGGSSANDWNDMSIKIFHKMDMKWLPHAVATFTPLPSAEEIKKVHFDMEKFEKLRALPPDEQIIYQTYDKLAAIGLRFGPIFQSLEEVWRNEKQGMLAKVKIPPATLNSEERNGDAQQYIVHPVVLDAMIQAVMIQKHSDKIKKKLYVPISISKFLWLANPQHENLYIYTEDTVEGKSEAILIDELGTVVAVMSGIELIDTTVKAVESVLEQQTSAMPDLWEESWRGKQGPMQQRIPEQILAENVYDKNFLEYMEKTYNSVPEDKEDIFTQLEDFVYYWILHGLYECGWSPQETDNLFTVDELMNKLKIEKGYTQYVKYFMEVLGQHGILDLVKCTSEESVPKWKITCIPPTHDEVQAHLSQTCYSHDLVKRFDPTRLIRRVGENLPRLFKGEQSPLQVLFPEDTKYHPSVSGFYDDYGSIFNIVGSISDLQRQRLSSWLERIKGKKADDGKFVFRILEVGAGTGIFTSHVLPVIDELGVEFEYTYTDISPAFFAAAEKRFEKFAGSIKFKKMNIEEDPVAQGFCPGYFDYAIASDVIHATKDVCNSLKNVRKLLRNGGTLDILEQIQKNRMLTFIFGLMDGFWRFGDFRKDHCTLTSSSWDECLTQSGFERVLTFPSFNGRHGLITSWASEKHTQGIPDTNKAWVILANPECRLSSFIKEQLGLASRQTITVHPSLSSQDFEEVTPEMFLLRHDSKAGFEKLMASIKTRKIHIEGVVYLWPLDSSRISQDEILQPYFYIAQTVYTLRQKVTPRVITVAQGVAPVGDSDLSHFHPSTLWGFTKALRNEDIDINSRCISITNQVATMTDDEMREIYHEIWCDDKEPQVAYSQGTRHVARFQPVTQSSQELPLPPGTNRFKLILPETKSIGDLQFGPLDHLILEKEEVEIHVKASALNFRDVFSVLKPTDQFKDINSVGFDFAGVVKRVGDNVSKWKVGDYVFGVNVKGAPLPSHLKLHEDDVLAVPDNMTLCEAATLPAVVSTAYYCLIDVAKLTPEDTVLIHTASGGVGLSSIDVVKSIGAKIIATAGSKRKQNYLRSLGIEHIFNSRNTNYGDEVLKITNGRGVNVVLNSLTSEGFKEATLKACAHGARFIEMSKLSIWTPEEVHKLRPDVEYTIVDISSERPEEWRRLIGSVQTLAKKKIVKPVPYVRFDGVNVREALQYLQKARHIGKVVCVMPELRLENGEYKAFTPMFNDRSTYLITGGLGGIGFEVAKWMVQKGAKHVILASRNPPKASTKAIIDQLNSQGANIIPVQLDVGNYAQCKELIEKIGDPSDDLRVPPLRGIMHAAGILSDGLIANQDWIKLSSTFNAKVDGTLNLHELTLGYPLEHFVLFSSITALMGTPGQCNHAAGNNFEDAFAHYRHSKGLCATTINWGQWGEIGVATEVDLPGMKPLSTLQGISALEYIMKTQRLQTSVMNMESFVLFSKLSPQTAVYLDERIWKTGSSSSSSMTIKSDEFWQQYDAKQDTTEKVALINSQLKDMLRKILKLDRDEGIEDDSNFQELGVDSLMFVEIKNAVQALLGDRVTVSASAMRDCNTTRLLSAQLFKLIEGDETCELDNPPTLQEVAELLLEDCQLPEHITAVGRFPEKKISEIGSVLLTGATGTLGPYLLKELSKLPQISQVYCLVRPSKSKSAKERMEQILEFRDLIHSVDMTKIKYVTGNVAKPKLGMNDDVWADLTQNIDAVFHCAVKADHTQYYKKREIEDVRNVNVGGTRNVLEFACEGTVKHIYFASSLLSVATTEEDGTLSESWPRVGDFDGVTNFAYANAKFVGDVLMTSAAERGLPVKVFRLPLIAGDSKTGKFNVEQNHMMLRYLFIMKNGIMPTNPFPMVILPVDTCASVSIELFFNEKLGGQCDIYNITHPSPCLDQEFIPVAERLGYSVRFVDFSEFTQQLLNEPEGSTFSMFKEMYKNEDELMAVYSIATSLRKWLEGVENFWVSKKVSAALPEFYSGQEGQGLEKTVDTLERDLRYARREGWFEKFGLRASNL